MSGNYLNPLHSFAKDIEYISPNDEYIENKRVVKEIRDAWDNSCVVDKWGNLWIVDTHLHSILRTTKDNAKYYVQQIEKSNKFKDCGVTYIRGFAIIPFIDSRLQNAGGTGKEKNLKYSYHMYSAIRDSDTARLLRAEYYESIKNCVKKLKKTRIKELDIEYDELTNEPLIEKTSEFSHIRSCSVYPYLMDNIFNGHVVNKRTHDIITRNSINDEEELYALCEELGWETEWYERYIQNFENL